MPHPRPTSMTAGAWLVAGILLVLYPATRPWQDEATLAGVVAWDSVQWQASHTAAILGLLVLLLAANLRAGATGTPGVVPVLAAGVALVLPYYGAEAYGLPMLGELARERQDAEVGVLAESFRFGAISLTLFGAGLILMVAAGARLISSAGRGPSRWGASLLGLWLIGFAPQFFFEAPVRIAHGVLALLACGALAIGTWRDGRSAAGLSATPVGRRPGG